MDKNCIFCKIINKEFDSYKLYEDDNFLVIFDIFPSTLGHTLIITKNHYKNFFDLDEFVASEILVLAQKVAIALKSVTGCEDMNIIQNNGAIAGQEVMHYHMHLVPRYKNDGYNFKSGEKEIDDSKAKEMLEQLTYQLEA